MGFFATMLFIVASIFGCKFCCNQCKSQDENYIGHDIVFFNVDDIESDTDIYEELPVYKLQEEPPKYDDI